MQVSHVSDKVTHAFIGGGKTQDFGIADSPEFFHILSSTLYSNQKLAMVRETICNAWDAHIDAGLTDTPIKLTLDGQKLVIQDFGKGIAPDMMGPLYATYGGTNKKNDGLQTGGFGLGCKAPFAYTDHFNVTSCHDGLKSIYNVSKSSAERMGKPGITEVLSVPTTESGVTVSINVKPDDTTELNKLIQEVIRNGGIKAQLNGVLLKVFPYAGMEDNWLITSTQPVSGNHTAYVRYGNVVYPIESHADYRTSFEKITILLNKLAGRNTYYASEQVKYFIIFMAQPNTIAVMPNREGLSMQDHTVKTLTQLMGEFIKKATRLIASESHVTLDRQIKLVSAEGRIGELLNNENHLPGFIRKPENRLVPLFTYEGLTTQFLKSNYPEDNEFYKQDLIKRLKAALALGVGKRGHLEELIRRIQGPTKKMIKQIGVRSYRYERSAVTRWFQKLILRPLFRDLQADPVMDHKKLYIYTRGAPNSSNLMPAKEESFYNYSDTIPLMRNVVLLTYSKLTAKEVICKFPAMEKLGDPEKIYVYVAPLAKTKVQAMRDFFSRRGFTVLDNTIEQPWHEKAAPKPKKDPDAPKVIKPKVEGFPTLSSARRPGEELRVDTCFLPNGSRISSPMMYVKVDRSRANGRSFEVCDFDRNLSLKVLKFFGDECAVITTDAQEEEMKKAGIPGLKQFILDSLCREVTTNPNFLAYWPQCVVRGYQGGKWIDSAYYSSVTAKEYFKFHEVRTALGLTAHLSEDELTIWEMFLDLSAQRAFRYNSSDEATQFGKAVKTITQIPLDPVLVTLVEEMRGSAILHHLMAPSLVEILNKPAAVTSDLRERMAQIFVTALRG